MFFPHGNTNQRTNGVTWRPPAYCGGATKPRPPGHPRAHGRFSLVEIPGHPKNGFHNQRWWLLLRRLLGSSKDISFLFFSMKFVYIFIYSIYFLKLFTSERLRSKDSCLWNQVPQIRQFAGKWHCSFAHHQAPATWNYESISEVSVEKNFLGTATLGAIKRVGTSPMGRGEWRISSGSPFHRLTFFRHRKIWQGSNCATSAAKNLAAFSSNLGSLFWEDESPWVGCFCRKAIVAKW